MLFCGIDLHSNNCLVVVSARCDSQSLHAAGHAHDDSHALNPFGARGIASMFPTAINARGKRGRTLIARNAADLSSSSDGLYSSELPCRPHFSMRGRPFLIVR